LIPAVLMLAIFFTALFYLLPENELGSQTAQHPLIEQNLYSIANKTGERNAFESAKSLNQSPDTAGNINASGKAGLLLKERPFEIEVFGRVIDTDGQPIEGVFVSEELNQRTTGTDAQGRFRMSVYMPKNKYPFLIFLRNGYREQREGVVLTPERQRAPFEINVTLSEDPSTTSFSGWIGNNFGQGVAGSTVKITSRGSMSMDNIYYAISSDENGEFHFEGIRSDIIYKLEVLASEDYPPHVIDELEVSMQTPRLNITIDKLSLINVTGMVVNKNSVPIPGLSINVKSLTAGSPPRKIVTDSSGFFNLNQFPSGEVRFSGKVPDYFKVSGITLADTEYQDLVLVIDRGGRYLSGWVSDNSGLPIVQARVTLDAELDADDFQSYSFRSRKTDSAGRFAFENLSDIDHVITVYAKGFRKQEIYHSFGTGNDYLSIRLLAE